MSGWGNSPWGSAPWGTGDVPPADGVVTAVDVLTSTLILVRFASAMKNDSRLQDPLSYSVVSTSLGTAVTIRSVETDTSASTTDVLLNLSAIAVGTTYTLTVTGMRTATGGVMSSSNRVQFIGRITKADSAINGTTRIYNTQPGAIYRNIILAITKEDDRIGGSRNDRLPSVDD